MSAVYTVNSFQTLWTAQLGTVNEYVKSNPGKSIEEIATAITQPYEVVWACLQALGQVIVPSASGEIHWHAHKP